MDIDMDIDRQGNGLPVRGPVCKEENLCHLSFANDQVSEVQDMEDINYQFRI